MSKTDDKIPEPRTYRGPGISPKWVPVIIGALGSIWAIHYVWHTNQNSYGDQDTVAFINFLIWPLVISAFFVAIGALKGSAEEIAVGLSDYRRILLIISVPLYGIAIIYGGFVLASVLYVLLLVPVLGVRSPTIILGIIGAVVLIVWFGFSYLMSVPIQLWPRGITF